MPSGDERAPEDADGRLQPVAGSRVQVRQGHPGRCHLFPHFFGDSTSCLYRKEKVLVALNETSLLLLKIFCFKIIYNF